MAAAPAPLPARSVSRSAETRRDAAAAASGQRCIAARAAPPRDGGCRQRRRANAIRLRARTLLPQLSPRLRHRAWQSARPRHRRRRPHRSRRWPRDAPPTADADDARVKDRAPLPVPDWIALIRRLRDEGKPAEAAKELAAFRAAHADHEKLLPPDLRDWRPPEK